MPKNSANPTRSKTTAHRKSNQVLAAAVRQPDKEVSGKGSATLEAEKISLSEAEKIRLSAIEDEKLRLRNLEWIFERMQRGDVPIYAGDFETDPFKRDEVPVPFLAGLYDGINYRVFKSDKAASCIDKMRCALEDGTLEPGIIYFHNGGRFDFFYMLDWFEGRTTIIGSRIVKALMPILDGQNKRRFEKGNCFEFRDSYAIMPFPLKAYKKLDIEISKLHKSVRASHMQEIVDYLEVDCVALWELVMEFHREFGDFLTIASAAFKQLTSFHQYDQLPTHQDEVIRGSYYFGGRVQCFQKGVIENPIEIFDVNSMYPYVMDSYFHPTGWIISEDTTIHGWNHDASFNQEKLKTFFLTVEGENNGAFPIRKRDGSVDFTEGHGVFNVTIHEWLTAIELGLFKPTRILRCINYTNYSRFHLFVDHYYRAREAAKLAGDKIHSLFYKYILNSAYGKFGLNPENYFNWRITKTAEPPAGPGWELDTLTHEKFYVWKQPNQLRWNVKNISTAASITGAARSILLRAIAQSTSVLYCDTDSIICQNFSGGRVDDTKLGAWKSEGSGDRVAIAGKKMYAVFDGAKCIKQANKGVELTPEQIVGIANGEEIITFREAPTFKRDGTATFLGRTSRMT